MSLKDKYDLLTYTGFDIFAYANIKRCVARVFDSKKFFLAHKAQIDAKPPFELVNEEVTNEEIPLIIYIILYCRTNNIGKELA